MLYSFVGYNYGQELLLTYKSIFYKKDRTITIATLIIFSMMFAFFVIKTILDFTAKSSFIIKGILSSFPVIIILTAIFSVLIFGFIFTPVTKARAQNRNLFQLDLPKESTYHFYQDYIEIFTVQSSARFFWNQFACAWRYKNIIVFEVNNTIFHFSLANLDDAQRNEFIQFIKNRINFI